MFPLIIFSLVCYASYFTAATFTGIYLIIQGIRTKLYNVFYISFGFFSFMLSVIAVDFNQNAPVILRSILSTNYPLFMVLFVKEAYYKKQKSNFKLVFAITMALKILHIVEINIFGHSIPSTEPILQGDIPSYYFHALVYYLLIAIPSLWFANAARKAYIKTKKEKTILYWATKRNLLISVNNYTFAITNLVLFFLPLDGLGYASPYGIPQTIILMGFVLFYSILTCLTWAMPQFLKDWLNKGFEGIQPLDKEEVVKATPELEENDVWFTKPKIMSLINYAGGVLAPLIQTTPSAARGLLILCIRQEFGDKGMEMLNFQNIDQILSNSFKTRLEKTGEENVEEIIKKMKDELVRNQSLLLMLAI